MDSGQSGASRIQVLSRTDIARFDADDGAAPAIRTHDDQQLRQLLLAAHDALGPEAVPGRVRRLTRLLWRLSHAAVTDPLTGLSNRRGFMRDGSRLLMLAARRRQCAVIFFIDVDGLKIVNDTDGHAAGDELLRAAACALSAAFRNGDVVGRIGGDEFAVVTRAARPDVAAVILRRLATVLTRVNAARRAWPIEVSVGLSVCTPECPQGLGALLHSADRRMYEDKRSRATILATD